MKISELIYRLSASLVEFGDLEISLELVQLQGDFGQTNNPQIPLILYEISDASSRRLDISIRFDRSLIFTKSKLAAIKTFLNTYI